jgi:hypothetical protein
MAAPLTESSCLAALLGLDDLQLGIENEDGIDNGIEGIAPFFEGAAHFRAEGLRLLALERRPIRRLDAVRGDCRCGPGSTQAGAQDCEVIDHRGQGIHGEQCAQKNKHGTGHGILPERRGDRCLKIRSRKKSIVRGRRSTIRTCSGIRSEMVLRMMDILYSMLAAKRLSRYQA